MKINILEIQNLQVSYGPVVSLKGVSLSVKNCSTTALLGANGAGKSTLLKAISGVLKSSYGSIKIFDEPIMGLDPSDIVNKGISHVPEGREIFPLLTVEQNLMLGSYSRSDKAKIKEDKAKVIRFFPILGELLKYEAKVLSGGQQQMLALGRALMSRPKVLLLDEPSLGLSPIVVKEFYSILKKLQKELGLSILLVEQNAELALEFAESVSVLEMGRIVMSGRAVELKKSREIQEFYLGIKANGQFLQKRWKKSW